MKVKNKPVDLAEGDLTPMIDMTFQLIAFFMVLINFAQTESNDRVKLPSSVLVKPPEDVIDFPVILHIAEGGDIIMGGEEYTAATLPRGLAGEISVLKLENKTPADANVIIRAHKDCAAGDVQEIISVCQESNFESFALRVKEQKGVQPAGGGDAS